MSFRDYIRYYPELVQGSDDWLSARCGILTASTMGAVLTPTLKVAANEGSRGLLNDLLSQRIMGYVEPGFVSYDMMRGHEDEVYARIAYSERYAEVREMGFIVNTKLGFPVGFSPDGLVGDDGFIEIKSRKPKFQIETIISGLIPTEYIMQIQTGLFVSGRKWCDFISYCAGLPMVTIRTHPDKVIISAIESASIAFEARIKEKLNEYSNALAGDMRFIPTERRAPEQEMYA